MRPTSPDERERERERENDGCAGVSVYITEIYTDGSTRSKPIDFKA
jgi:hypothetical protein